MGVEVAGLVELVKTLKGPMFRDVNKELRSEAYTIARDMEGPISSAIAGMPAPQAGKVSDTVRAVKDRVPVVAIGKTNPKLSKFARRGPRRDGGARANPRKRAGSVAHGVVYGPLGGRRSTSVHENYYKTGRDSSGGRLGAGLREGGSIFETACREYLHAFEYVLAKHGFVGSNHEWNGHG